MKQEYGLDLSSHTNFVRAKVRKKKKRLPTKTVRRRFIQESDPEGTDEIPRLVKD